MSFQDALTATLKFEGGYANNPNDPGGKTNFGITQNVYDPTMKKDVKTITPQEVHRIYESSYWITGRCDRIDLVNPHLAIIHFDNAVNCGTYGAARMLQDVLKVKPDGIVGNLTLEAITSSVQLCKDYLDRRKLYYDRVIEHRPEAEEFRSSWYHRLNSLAKQFSIDWSSNAKANG